MGPAGTKADSVSDSCTAHDRLACTLYAEFDATRVARLVDDGNAGAAARMRVAHVGVRIRRPIRCPDDAGPCVLQSRADRLIPLRIPIADQQATSDAVRDRERPHDLAHESVIGMRVDPRIWIRREARSITKTV